MAANVTQTNPTIAPADGWTKVTPAGGGSNVSIKSHGTTRPWYVYAVTAGGTAPAASVIGLPMGNGADDGDMFQEIFAANADVYVRAPMKADSVTSMKFSVISSSAT